MTTRTVRVLAVLALLLAALSFSRYGMQPDVQDLNLWLAFGPSLLLVAVAIALAVWSLSPKLRPGKVIEQRFNPSYTDADGRELPNTWALLVEDEHRRTRWVDFRKNIFKKYPRGSTYPTWRKHSKPYHKKSRRR